MIIKIIPNECYCRKKTAVSRMMQVSALPAIQNITPNVNFARIHHALLYGLKKRIYVLFRWIMLIIIFRSYSVALYFFMQIFSIDLRLALFTFDFVNSALYCNGFNHLRHTSIFGTCGSSAPLMKLERDVAVCLFECVYLAQRQTNICRLVSF